MKLNKTIFIMCIAVLGILMVAQSSHAYTMMVNLGQQTDGTEVGKKVDDAVKNPGEAGTDKIASNATLVLTNFDLLGKIAAIKEEDLAGTVTLAEAVKANIPGDVQDQISYALNLAVVGGTIITATGSTYNVEENTTVHSVIFAASEVLANPVVFADAVGNLKGDQLAVILPVSDAERVKVLDLQEVKTKGEKVVVAPTILTTNILLTAIYEEAVKKGPIGISLTDALSSPAVEEARQGQV